MHSMLVTVFIFKYLKLNYGRGGEKKVFHFQFWANLNLRVMNWQTSRRIDGHWTNVHKNKKIQVYDFFSQSAISPLLVMVIFDFLFFHDSDSSVFEAFEWNFLAFEWNYFFAKPKTSIMKLSFIFFRWIAIGLQLPPWSGYEIIQRLHRWYSTEQREKRWPALPFQGMLIIRQLGCLRFEGTLKSGSQSLRFLAF